MHKSFLIILIAISVHLKAQKRSLSFFKQHINCPHSIIYEQKCTKMDNATLDSYFRSHFFSCSKEIRDSLKPLKSTFLKYSKNEFYVYKTESYTDTVFFVFDFHIKANESLVEFKMPRITSKKFGINFFKSEGIFELKDSIINVLYTKIILENNHINFLENSCLFNDTDLNVIRFYSFHSRFPTGNLAKEFDKEIFFSDNKKDWKKVFQIKEDSDVLNQNLDSIKIRLLPIINSREEGGGAFCGFRPHHFLRIYDKNKTIIGEMDICFECGDLELYSFKFNMNCLDLKKCTPRIGNTNYYSDKILVGLMKNAGIKNFGNINEY